MKTNWYKILFFLLIVCASFFRIYVIEKTPLTTYTQVDAGIGNPQTVEDYEKLFDLDEYKENDEASLDDEMYNERLKRGHFYYIMYLFKNHKLCDTTIGQRYHPPIHYILSATLLSVTDKLPLNAKQKIEGIQYIGLIYFWISLFLITKLLNKMKLSEKVKLIIVSLYCFFPKIIQMSTYITNDYLVFVFQLWCILALIKWNEKDSYKNTLELAFAYGLGNLVKYNCVLLGVPIGIVFLRKIIKEEKENKTKIIELFPKMIIFAIIAGCLSLSYMLRCLIALGDYIIVLPRDALYIRKCFCIR